MRFSNNQGSNAGNLWQQRTGEWVMDEVHKTLAIERVYGYCVSFNFDEYAEGVR
jgi:hypothetical protein